MRLQNYALPPERFELKNPLFFFTFVMYAKSSAPEFSGARRLRGLFQFEPVPVLSYISSPPMPLCPFDEK